MSNVTRILAQMESGDPLAAEELLPLVYQELRKLAAARLSREKPGQTLQPTVLPRRPPRRNGRGHSTALDGLEERWPEKSKLVKMRYFAGMTILEAAEAMGISHATAERYWTFARAWLHSQLKN